MELLPINQLQQVAYLYCRGLREVNRELGVGANAIPVMNFYFEKEPALKFLSEYGDRNVSALELFKNYYTIMQSVKGVTGR